MSRKRKHKSISASQSFLIEHNSGAIRKATGTFSAAKETSSSKFDAEPDPTIEITPLGAAQYVGKSCILVKICGRLIMLDCGMHLGFTSHRRYPDFKEIGDINRISCVIITHFHLDHCAALPYFTETLGYQGPIFMTTPTRALCRIMLEDYERIMKHRYGVNEIYTSKMISSCLKKVTCVSFKERFSIPHDPDIHFVAYHAGHVLGAAMIGISAASGGNEPISVLYTGDYNMTPDRHLAAAKIPRFLPGCNSLKPDVLITESTYATSTRDSRLLGESEILRTIHNCVSKNGKVLLPVFAVGRAQELCLLLDRYWERSYLSKIPVYFSSKLSKEALSCYGRFSTWNGVKENSGSQSYLLKHVTPWKYYGNESEKMLQSKGPMVLLATSATLEGGLSLSAFKIWASDPKNLILMPGNSAPGTLAGRLTSNERSITLKGRNSSNQILEVKCQVKQVANFSAHTDSKGIMDLLQQFKPKLAVLVHGEKEKMARLGETIEERLGILTVYPEEKNSVKVFKT